MTLSQPKNNQIMSGRIMVFLAILSLLLNPAIGTAKPNETVASVSQNLTTNTAESAVSGLPSESQNSLDEASLDPLEGVTPSRVVKTVLTAYTSTPDQTDSTPCITADGTNVCKTKIPAVAANWLPFGTKIKIPALFGDKIFEVHDRMNKRYGFGRMDVWFDTSKTEARKFGVQRTEIEIYYIKALPKELAKR